MHLTPPLRAYTVSEGNGGSEKGHFLNAVGAVCLYAFKRIFDQKLSMRK